MAILTAGEALHWALGIEENGKRFYTEVSKGTTDRALRVLFEDLASQEQQHYDTFKTMLDEVEPAADAPAVDYDEYQAYLKATLDSGLFEGPDKVLRLVEEAGDTKTAIRAAMAFEKDTMLFYYDLREWVSDAGRAVIFGIMDEEKAHLRRLAKML
jgi:rubrerythrin